MVLQTLGISNTVLLLLAVFYLTLLILLLTRQNRSEAVIVFSIISVCLILWTLAIFFSNISQTDQQLLLSTRLAFVGPSFLGILFLYFVSYFPKANYKLHPYIKYFFIVLSFILLSLSSTSLIVKNAFFDELGKSVYVYGKLYPLFFLYFLTTFTYSFFILIRKYRFSKDLIEKLQIKYLFIGLLLSSVFGIATNLFLPMLGYSELGKFGPISIIFLFSFTTYAITKHHLMNIRVIATELLVGIVGIILLIDLLSSKGLSAIALKVGILVAFGYLSYLLIKSVYLEIQRREEIEKIDRAKSEFISITSHQLRTPLTAVKGYISMILEGTYGQLAEKQAKPLENVYQSNERLIRLVNDLLNLSRLDAGKIEFSPELTSLEEMVSGVVEELIINAEKKGLYMKMEKPTRPLPKIMVDKDKLRQVILNIVDNAIKYTKDGGITLKLKRVDDSEEIKIIDTGEGMTEKELKSLFQMFSRATAGTQLHAEGAGLGLYVARQFIEMHKGKIWAESKGKGRGSTFTIQLPIKLDLELIKGKNKIITKVPNK